MEVQELLTYFNIPENETLLRNFILQNLEAANSIDGEEYSQWMKSTEVIYVKLKMIKRYTLYSTSKTWR